MADKVTGKDPKDGGGIVRWLEEQGVFDPPKERRYPHYMDADGFYVRIPTPIYGITERVATEHNEQRFKEIKVQIFERTWCDDEARAMGFEDFAEMAEWIRAMRVEDGEFAQALDKINKRLWKAGE